MKPRAALRLRVMKYKARAVALAALPVAALMLLGVTSARLKDSRFDVTSVTVNGPNSIKNGSTANYTVTANIQRTGATANSTITGTGSPPQVRPQLTSGGNQLVFQAVDFPPNVNTTTETLTLNCTNNEVRGAAGGSGKGNPKVANW